MQPSNRSYWPALLFLMVLFSTIIGCLVFLQLPVPVCLAFVTAETILYGLIFQYRYDDMQKMMLAGIQEGLEPVLILCGVGMLVGSWMQSGIVGCFVVYGMELLHADGMLPISMITCMLCSLATGTSWGAIGTLGVALMAVGSTMGIEPGLMAGAIMSGAYFGDKLSPLSDSTILTANLSSVPVYEHIRTQAKMDIPAFLFALCLFYFMGLQVDAAMDTGPSDGLVYTLKETFELSPLLFLAPAMTVGMMILGVPTLPVLLAGALGGAVLGILLQDQSLHDALLGFYRVEISATGNSIVDDMLSRGGLSRMFDSILVIVLGLGFGRLLEELKVLDVIFLPIKKVSASWLVGIVHLIVGILGNVFGCAMYVAIILTSKVMKPVYERQGLARTLLARQTETSATLTSCLVPWSDNGVYAYAMLGVGVVSYGPYLFYTYASAVFSVIILGWIGRSRSR